ncbi:MAG: hypothetical protein E6H75_09215 [Betaproteobacteria bacterium]|nr:MAG: hypothetical protein E6H75_09215 [Betaproteobacteria bacterium]
MDIPEGGPDGSGRAFPGVEESEMNRKQARAAAASPQSGVAAAAVAVWLMASGSPVLAAESADTLLVNGKIITVDDRFTIAQGVAIKGQHIVAVGGTGQILKLKGAATKVIDLANRTVIPGLIDNHAHFIRAPEHDEMRLDGVTSRREAPRVLAARVHAARPGEWIATLGGWSEKRLFRQHRLGRIGVHARHDQSPALRLRGEAGRHARSAPH